MSRSAGRVSHHWKKEIDARIAQGEHRHEWAHVMDQQAAGVATSAAIRAETMPEHGHEHEKPNPLEDRDPEAPTRIEPVRLAPVYP
jgi:hypothetical protein